MALDSVNNYGSAYDDFYAQQYFAKANQPQVPQTQTNAGYYQQQPQTPQNPAFTGYYQQPAADTFQKSGGSALPTALALGTVAGGAAGAGTYYWGANPVKDGKVDESLLGSLDDAVYQDALKGKKEELLTNAKQTVLDKYKIKDEKSLEAIKKFVEAEDKSKLSKEVMDLIPDDMKSNPKAAKIRSEAALKEIGEIKVDDITKEAEKLISKDTLKFKAQELTDLKSFETKLTGLADDIKPADLEKFIKENAKSFGITGDEKAIETEAKRLAAKGKAELLTSHKAKITTAENAIKTVKENLGKKFTTYWDDTAKALKKETPEALTKAFKNFKWNKALKGGGIAAAAGVVLGLLFGNNA